MPSDACCGSSGFQRVSSTGSITNERVIYQSTYVLLNIASRAGGAQISKIKPLGIDINVPYVQTGVHDF